MFGDSKTLIVVYKDEMLLNQLKKMVETNDDGEEIVGTKDGSINIVSWEEKVWLDNKKAGNIKGKVLFIDNIKGTDKLVPVIDIKFDKYGTKFGWAGNQAILFTDLDSLNQEENYKAFVEELSTLPIPEKIKKPQSSRDERKEEIGEIIKKIEEKEIKGNNTISKFFNDAKKIIKDGINVAEKTSNIVTKKAEELFREKNVVKKQQLFYGIINLYNDGLEKFMNE